MSTRLVVIDYYNKVKNKKLTLDLRPVKLQLFQSPRGVMVAITYLDTNTTIYMTPSEFLRRNYINRIQVVDETKQGNGE
ncbi:MAG: hypothetical protein QXP36_08685 [Conexivisphaerales archaeon]|uniref:hypothetical protein n=1 Tax=Metallosphaera sp. TaxID=2020860 RepID=UPI00316F9883